MASLLSRNLRSSCTPRRRAARPGLAAGAAAIAAASSCESQPQPHGALHAAQIQAGRGRRAHPPPRSPALAVLVDRVLRVALPPAAGALAEAALPGRSRRRLPHRAAARGCPRPSHQRAPTRSAELAEPWASASAALACSPTRSTAPGRPADRRPVNSLKVVSTIRTSVATRSWSRWPPRLAATMRHNDLLGGSAATSSPRSCNHDAAAGPHSGSGAVTAALAEPMVVHSYTSIRSRRDQRRSVSAAGRPGTHAAATLFREADTAMYRAKRSRQGTAIAATALAERRTRRARPTPPRRRTTTGATGRR